MSTDYAGMPDWMRPVDQAAEHWAHEENSRYDRYDGWGDPDLCGEDPGCPDCHDTDADCPECAEARAWMKEDNKKRAAARAAYVACTEEPPF